MLFFCIHRINKALSSCSDSRLLCGSLIIRPASENCFSTGDEHRTRFFCPVLPCPTSYLRPGGRQDRTKIKDASCPTGQDTRTACPMLSSGVHTT